ncbi:MAG: signal peptidase I [Microbacterium sp.]
MGAFVRDLVVIIAIALVVSFVIKTFLVRSFYIPSGSMETTLLVDDRVLVDEVTPHWDDYSRGDVVVFRDPGGWLSDVPKTERSPVGQVISDVLTFVGLSAGDSDDHLVKRIIGLPGDHVVCCNAMGQITVNDVAIDELGYLNLPEGDTAASNDPFDVTVPAGSLWVMGDNRDRSADSRAHQDQPGGGFVPLDNVVGRVWLRTWPLDRLGFLTPENDVFRGVPDSEDTATEPTPAATGAGDDE